MNLVPRFVFDEKYMVLWLHYFRRYMRRLVYWLLIDLTLLSHSPLGHRLRTASRMWAHKRANGICNQILHQHQTSMLFIISRDATYSKTEVIGEISGSRSSRKYQTKTLTELLVLPSPASHFSLGTVYKREKWSLGVTSRWSYLSTVKILVVVYFPQKGFIEL